MKIKFVINCVLTFLISIPIFGQRPNFQSKFILKGKVVDLLSYEKDGTTAYQFWVQNIVKIGKL